MMMPKWCTIMNMWCDEMDDEDIETAGCDSECCDCEHCDMDQPDGADCDIEQ